MLSDHTACLPNGAIPAECTHVAGTPAHSVAYIVDVDSRLPKLDRLIDYTPTAIHNAWYPIKAALNV